MSHNPAFQTAASEKLMQEEFLEGPGQYMVRRLIKQMAKEKGFIALFGEYKGPESDSQRWAEYQRFDWSVRQLPAISVYEDQSETKTADSGWVTGTLKVTVYWPPRLHRRFAARLPNTFFAALMLWMRGAEAFKLLDSRANVDRTLIVPGLNQLGFEMTDIKQVEGIVETEAVPVSLIDVRFRLDLRAWDRWMTQEDCRDVPTPFVRDLETMETLTNVIQGVIDDDGDPVKAEVQQNVTIDP